MNWLKQFNDTVSFIEENITENISKNDIEKISYTSYLHYSRMFFILSGNTLSEYIRKRRLSLAASDLVVTEDKVIDIAYKYQYKTPESFTKAFKQFHSMSPRDARKLKDKLKSFPKLSFKLTVDGGVEMDYQIIKKDGLDFIGYVKEVTTVDNQNFVIIPAFWQEIMEDGRFKELCDNADELGIVGICYDMDLEHNVFKYMIGIRTDKSLENTSKVSFEPNVFAQFKAVGKLPGSIQETTKFIYQEWFPSSNYEYGTGPELEIYPDGDTSSDAYECYYLVPINHKK